MTDSVERSVFIDSATLMLGYGQDIEINPEQALMYFDLIGEEVAELETAWNNAVKNKGDPDFDAMGSVTAVADALIDIMVVTAGAINSLGLDGQALWDEVFRSNLAKIDPDTGQVIRREDGKVLKPEGWQPPNLRPIVAECLEGMLVDTADGKKRLKV